MARTLLKDDALFDYVLRHQPAEDEVLIALRERTAQLGSVARMQIAPDQVAALRLLVQLVGARSVVEIGTFTGMSSLAMASALDDVRVVTCDVSEEYTSIALEAWRRAGVDDRIELRLGPAVDTLDGFLAANAKFDLAFIDADKANYSSYWERCVKLIRPGGLIVVDNVLWGGSVIDASDQTEDTVAIRALNTLAARDPRVTMTLLSAFDGLLVARVRPPHA